MEREVRYAETVLMLHAQEKAKRAAWQKLVDEKVSPQDAQKKYVALVESLKKKYGYTG